MINYRLLILLLASASVDAEKYTGSVCFGANLAKPISEHTDRLYLKINESKKLYFNRKYKGPALKNLNLDTKHMVKVYFDDQITTSWPLDFKILNTNSVLIWRSAGSWRMDSIKTIKCK
jgi:hypothetical protein